MLAAYQTASVLSVPSVSEGLPTTILEGMAHELPVVATNLDPICDWFDDHALLVDSEPDAFADALNRILANDRLAAELGAEGEELVQSRFTWDRVSEDVRRVYEDVVGRRGSFEENDPAATPSSHPQ